MLTLLSQASSPEPIIIRRQSPALTVRRLSNVFGILIQPRIVKKSSTLFLQRAFGHGQVLLLLIFNLFRQKNTIRSLKTREIPFFRQLITMTSEQLPKSPRYFPTKTESFASLRRQRSRSTPHWRKKRRGNNKTTKIPHRGNLIHFLGSRIKIEFPQVLPHYREIKVA